MLLTLAWSINVYTQTVVKTWTALQTALATDGSNIQLGQDITAGESDTDLRVPDNVTVTLDLKGYMIDRGLTDRRPSERGSVITIDTEGTLTINDTSTGKTGKITGGIANGGAGILNGGHLTINGGSITGNRSLQNGSGIYNQKGSITISGGNITNNVSSGANGVGYGGGIYNLAGTVIINSGSISNNTTYGGGGGIYNTFYSSSQRSTLIINGGNITGNRTSNSNGQGGGGIYNSGSDLIISGGSITNNESGSYGGGIYNNSGNLTISNCSITGNSAAGRYSRGGGVYINSSTETATISGNVIIDNNTLGTDANNLYLAGSTILTIGGTITSSNKKIGISLEYPLRVFTTGGLSNKGGINKLFSDNSLCQLTSSGTEARMMGNISPSVTIQEWTYGGTAQEPEITGTCISNDICYDGTYSITYQKNQTGNWITSQPVTAGTHNVKVSFPATSNYNAVDAVSSYTVAKANLSVTAPTAASPTYNGNNQNLLATNGSAANGTFYYRLGTGGTWSTTAPKAKNAGSYQVYYYVKGDANHKDSGSESNPLGPVSCTIGKAASSLTADPTRASLTYNGSNQNLLATSGTASGGTIYYKLGIGAWGTAIPQAKDANTYSVKYYVKGDDNHNDIGTTGNPIGTISCAIGKKSITISGITANDRAYNGGTNATLNYTNVTYGGKVGNDALSVSATGTFENKNVGTNKPVYIRSLTLSGSKAGNYQLAASGQQSTTTATITAKQLTITSEAKSKTYGDADPALTYTQSGLVNGDNITGNLARNAGEDVGTYAITQNTLTAGNNYSITYNSANLTIGAKTLTVTADAKNKTYGEADPALTYTSVGLIGSDAITGTLSRAIGEDIGTYAITQNTLTAGNNYSITYNGANLTIVAKAVTVSGIGANNKIYDGTTNATLNYDNIVLEGKVGSDALSLTASGTFDSKNVGTGKTVSLSSLSLTGTKASNYVLAGSGQQSSTTADITAKTAELGWGATSFDYDGYAKVPTCSVSNLVDGDNCNVTVNVAGDHTAVGYYTATAAELTGTDNGNYALPAEKTHDYEIVRPMTGIEFTASKHWNTYYAFENLATPTGIKAYIVTGVSGTTATTSEIGYIPKDVGVLLYSASAGSGFKASAYTGAAGSFTSNKLNGSTTTTDLDSEAGYILYGDAFVLTTGGTLPANRCYLPANMGAGTRSLTIDGGDGTTSIYKVNSEEMGDDKWFDLQGQRIEKPQKKGLYIKDGKKVVIK